MFIVTVKSIDADSFALPTLYGKTTLQNYNFSGNPQEVRWIFFFCRAAAAMSCRCGMVRWRASMAAVFLVLSS